MITESGLIQKKPKNTEMPHLTPKGLSIFIFMSMLILGTVFCSGAVYHYITTVRANRFFRDQTANNIIVLAGSVKTTLAALVVFDNYDELNNVILNTFGFNEDVQDVFIVIAGTGKIYYDFSGRRENKIFDDSMKTASTIYYETDIVPPTGMGIVVPKEPAVAQLIIGYTNSEPMSARYVRILFEYSKTIFHEISSLLNSGQVGQVRVFLSNLMLSNEKVKNIQLINGDGVVFANLRSKGKGDLFAEKEGFKVDKKTFNLIDIVSNKKPIHLNIRNNKKGVLIYEIYMAMIKGYRKNGTVRIEYDASDFAVSQKRTEQFFYFAILSFVIVGFAGALYSSYWISKPIGKLVSATRKIGMGQLDEEVNVRFAGREIMSLVKSFNQMVRQRKKAELELRNYTQQLKTLSQKIITAQEVERARLGRELHDDFGHKFMTLSLNIETLRKKQLLPSTEIDVLSQLVGEISKELMSIYRGLKPTVIDRFGLTATIESQLQEIKSQKKIGLKYELDHIDKDDISYDTAVGIYRIFQESMTNIFKHSMATSVEIKLKKQPASVSLSVVDNGCGMDTENKISRGEIGIVSMRERANSLGGDLQIESSLGLGTTVSLFVPIKT